MSTNPASILERIAFHRSVLEDRFLDPVVENRHRRAVEVLLSENPYTGNLAEIAQRLAQPVTAAERALLAEEEHKLVKLAERWELTESPKATTNRRWNAVFLSEGVPGAEPSEADRIIADISGKPLAPAEAPQPIDPDRLRRLQDVRAYADEGDRLRLLAEDLPAAEAEEALSFLELQEADPSGTLSFGLSERERAAAELLRRDREYSALLAETVAEVRAADAAKRVRTAELAETSRQLNLAESSGVYDVIDSHSTRLLCIDSTTFTDAPNQ